MKLSLAWLRELAALPHLEQEEAARRLTAAGFHVEGIEAVAGDVALDVDVTTNRVDAMNHLGLARELAALCGGALQDPRPVEVAAGGDPSLVRIEAPALCRRYVGVVVRGVKVGPSPGWMQRRLEAIGLRPINNVVDVTNYVLWESGQPLHAFDLATLREGRIVVREARAGETLRTLDGVDRELAPGMLVIADAGRAVGLAGVMGGEATEVTATTTDVLLESAWFDPLSVRRTAKRLGMHTDASHRFERGVDPAGQQRAALRAAALLAEVAGARAPERVVDATGEPLLPLHPIPLSAARLARFAGAPLGAAEVERLLPAIGFALRATGNCEWSVTVPSWRRFDVVEQADLFEEVMRLHGFDAVAPALPAVAGPDAAALPGQLLRQVVKEHLAASGLAEAIAWAFYGESEDERFAAFGAPGPALRLVNPLSERHARMRRSLLPGLVEAASFNRRRDQPAVRLFEVGHVFWRTAEGEPREAEHVALVCGGRLGNPWQRGVELDFFDMKGLVESLAARIGAELEARPATVRGLVPGRAAHLHRKGDPEVVGILGQVEEPAEAYPLFVAELQTAPFVPLPPPVLVEPPSRYPAIAVDLTLTHAVEVPWSALREAVEAQRPPDLRALTLENRYQGQGVPAGAVNTTLHFVYRSAERSLTQDEVNARQAEVAALLLEKFGWR